MIFDLVIYMNFKKAYIRSTIRKSILIPLIIIAVAAGAFYLSLPQIENHMPGAQEQMQSAAGVSDNE